MLRHLEMAWRARLLGALLLTLVVGAEGAAAHTGASAYILVTADFILPGVPFEVIAADMGAHASVSMRLEHERTAATLGTIRAAPDGHFTTSLVVPADFPTGYAQLIATASQGASVSAWVHIGEPGAATPPRPGAGPWWMEPSVVVLLVFLIGAVAAIGYLILRRRSPGVEPARASERGVPRSRCRDRHPPS